MGSRTGLSWLLWRGTVCVDREPEAQLGCFGICARLGEAQSCGLPVYHLPWFLSSAQEAARLSQFL